MEEIFGRHLSTLPSVANLMMTDINEEFGHLLDDMNNHSWLSLAKLELCSQVRPCEFCVNVVSVCDTDAVFGNS